MIDSAFWRGRRVFLTGHTGFKGAWLSLALKRLNARATGYALAPPSAPSLFDVAQVAQDIDDIRGDVGDLGALSEAMRAAEPEIVIHMAAQSLVRAAYADPVDAYATNVMGSVHVLEAARTTPGVRAIVVVTTDKCYDNRDWLWAYRENDPLGGRDPYSSSKACAELVARCYRDSFFSAQGAARIVTARAGNVIGGGDFAADRIVPDAMRAFIAGRPLRLRHPRAVRPWQHVMEPLAGYLLLAEAAAKGALPAEESVFNFGPGAASERSVEELVAGFVDAWGRGANWTRDDGPHPHEAPTLRLDASKAREILGWRPLLDFNETTDWTAHWYRAFAAGADMRDATLRQIDAYLGQRVKLVSPFSETEAGADALRASA